CRPYLRRRWLGRLGRLARDWRGHPKGNIDTTRGSGCRPRGTPPKNHPPTPPPAQPQYCQPCAGRQRPTFLVPPTLDPGRTAGSRVDAAVDTRRAASVMIRTSKRKEFAPARHDHGELGATPSAARPDLEVAASVCAAWGASDGALARCRVKLF